MTPISFTAFRISIPPALAIAIMLRTVAADAQQGSAPEKPLSFGVGAGVAVRPGGQIGPLGLGMLEFRTPWRDLGIRFDGAYSSWQSETLNSRVTSLTADLVYSHRIGAVAPYLLGGAGGYAEKGAGAAFGVTGGVGIRAYVRGVQPFVELREHIWSSDRTRRSTPLAIGFRF
jgi:hypothetical protein